MTTKAPYASGDKVRVLHSCEGRGTELATMTVERVVPLNENGYWRIETHRCDGTPLHAVVNRRGTDAHGYVERA